MSLSHNDHACPVCGRPMRLLTTIRRVPGEQTLVLQCRRCGLSTTETVDAPQTTRERALTLRHLGHPRHVRRRRSTTRAAL
jgi:C4-type Zn-finger protein